MRGGCEINLLTDSVEELAVVVYIDNFPVRRDGADIFVHEFFHPLLHETPHELIVLVKQIVHLLLSFPLTLSGFLKNLTKNAFLK